MPFVALTAHVPGIDDDDPTSRNVIDEVIWVVGDEPILKSEVEGLRLQAEMEGSALEG